MVAAAGGKLETARAEALNALCREYWYPLYAYIRRSGNGPEEAKDLTQSFLLHLLEKGVFGMADRERGRFRTFLLANLKNFLIDQNRRSVAAKRGGGQIFEPLEKESGEERYRFEPLDSESPDLIYDRGWAKTVLQRAVARLREESALTKHGPGFDALKGYVWGERSGVSCAELGRELGISEEAAKKTVQRMRRRFGELLRQQIAETVSTPTELEEELRYLASLLK